MVNQDPFGLQELRTSIKERPQRTFGKAQTVAQQVSGEQKKEGFLETIVSAPIEFGKDIAEIFPDVQYARGKIQELRDAGNVNFADKLEKQIGEKPTMAKVIGDAAGTALLALPIPGLKFLKVAPTLRTFVGGGLIGGGFGAADALSKDKDFAQIASQTVISGLIGAPLMAGSGLVMKWGTGLVGKGISKVGPKIPEALKPIYLQLANMGEAGKILSDNFRKIQISARQEAGVIINKFSRVGLSKIFRLTPFQKKPAPLLSKESAYLGKNSLVEVLEGRATLKNATPEVRAAYKVANQTRMELGQKLKENIEGFTLRKNFFKRITPDPKIVQLSSAEKLALKNAKTVEERVAIHLQSSQKDSLRRRVLVHAVEKRKAFTSIEKAAETLDGWAEWVTSGGRIEKRGGIEKMVNHLIVSGQAKSKSNALNKMRKMFIEGKSSLLKERELDFVFYEPDPRVVLPAYVVDATLRIEQNKFLSKKIQQKLLNQIQQDGGFDVGQRATELVENVIGAVSRAPAGEKASVFLRALQVPKLAFAQILNLGQNVNTYLATDLGSFSYGLAKSFTDKGVREALKSGATLQTLIRQQVSYIGGGTGFADKFLRYSGFTWTEMFNRTVASNAGQKYVQQVAVKLAKNPTNRYLQWQAKEMGIPDERINEIVKGVKVFGKPVEKAISKIPKELESLASISKMGKANIKLGQTLEEAQRLATYTDRLGVQRIDGVKRVRLEKELLKKYNKELGVAQNEFYQSLKPKHKIGEVVNYQSKMRPEEIKVFGYKKYPIEKIKITGAEFDMIKSADQMKRTGFPASFKFENLVGKNIKTGEEVRLYKSSIVNGKLLGDTIKIQPEEVLKKFVAAQKLPKIAETDTYTQATKGVKEAIPAIPEGALLTKEEILQAGAIMARETQFFSDPLNLPAFASSPWGKVLVQYKNFSYNQLRFIHRQLIIKPTAHQTIRTMLILSTLFPMVGEVTSDIRSLITGRKRPTKALDRYLQNIANAGTFGLALDLWQSAQFGAGTEFFVGPTMTSAGNLVNSHVRSITKGDPDPTLKFWLQQTGVGRIVSNRIWESKIKGQGGVFEFWEDL